MIDPIANQAFCDQYWQEAILPSLIEYVRIPNKSPMYDPEWQSNGYMLDAVGHMVSWVEQQGIGELIVNVHQLPERTPTILIERPGETDESVLIYGHLDKQPEFEGWREGLGPWIPVVKNNRLYGRGGADDGYAIYAAIAAIRSLGELKLHDRVILPSNQNRF